MAENKRNVAEYESILTSIDESSTDDDSDDGYISTNTLEDIRNVNYLHPGINTRYARLKIHERIRQTQGEWKGLELSAKRVGKGLHKIFKAVVNELKNLLPILG